jgi:hypothetical protein
VTEEMIEEKYQLLLQSSSVNLGMDIEDIKRDIKSMVCE